MRILIAEDDLTSRTILKAMVKSYGYDVVVTEDGVQAWEVLQSDNPPKLAVLDWEMPNMTGLDVIIKHRAENFSDYTYFILLTGKVSKAEIVEGISKGADDYIVKPCDPEELSVRIRAGVRIINLQQKLAIQLQELREAMEHIKTLGGIIPICAYCKKIRDDKGYWDQVEAYVSQHSDAKFSHSICPDCVKEHYSDILGDEEIDENTK